MNWRSWKMTFFMGGNFDFFFCFISMKINFFFHMRYHLFLHYGWFLQNLGKDFIRTNMHTTVLLEIPCYIYNVHKIGVVYYCREGIWLTLSIRRKLSEILGEDVCFSEQLYHLQQQRKTQNLPTLTCLIMVQQILLIFQKKYPPTRLLVST